MEEVAIGNVGNSIGTKNVRHVDRERGKIETTGEKTGDWHDDVVDEGFYDSGKGATNSDTDGEINNATTIDELAEFFEEGTIFEFLKDGFAHKIYYNINKEKINKLTQKTGNKDLG